MVKNIPPGALEIIKVLHQHGHQAYLVGGCVRDSQLDIPIDEWDITTSAKPAEVTKLFKKVIPTGLEFGTVSVLLPDGQYEVTTFRSDEKYVDGRHPSNVVFTDDICQDLSRRDFTINALAFDPETNELIDNYDGLKDLKNKIIRAIGDPIDRFSEDGLRSIRACRFAAKLEFGIEPKTLAAIKKTLHVTKKVSVERIHDELVKLLKTDEPSIGLELMRETGLMALVIPELLSGVGVEQPKPWHLEDVYWHNLHTCDAAPKDNYVVRLAALLHDVAKPQCKDGDHYYGHDAQGAAKAEEILKRLKFSNADIKQVANLISQHMFNYTATWTDSAVRRYIRRIGGVENIADMFALRRADLKAMQREEENKHLLELHSRIDKIIEAENALAVADLKINGQDVMAVLKIKPGPRVGEVLDALLEKVLDHPELNTREKLLEIVTSLSK